MKRWIVIALLLMAPAVAWSQDSYIMQTDVWVKCGTVGVSIDGYSWTFPGSWTEVTHNSQLVTFTGSIIGKVVALQPNNGSCCSGSPDCTDPTTGSISALGDGAYTFNSFAFWEFHADFTKLIAPVIEEQQCDWVKLKGVSASRVDMIWQVSATGTDPWYSISSNYVTASIVDNETPLDPYEQLFARYIPRGLHTSDPSGYRSFPPSTNVPFRLYHAAPELSLIATPQLCETVSGVTVSDATLLLPQVKISIRKDNNGVWETVLFDTDYNSSTFEGRFFALAPGSYEMAARNWGGAATDVCPKIFPFEITGTYPAVTITPSVTHETCYGPAATGSINLTVGGAGTTAPYTYAWTHGPITQNVSGLAGDRSYFVTVRDANGCSGTSNIPVEEPDAIATTSAYVLTDVSCHANTTGTRNDGVIRIEASGGTGALQYRVVGTSHNTSYPGATDIGGLYADTYTVYVRDANLCEVSFSSTVPLSGPTDVTYTSIDKEDVTCSGIPSGSIKVVGAAGGTGSFQYALDGGTYQSSDFFR
jgi:hypothetical protein